MLQYRPAIRYESGVEGFGNDVSSLLYQPVILDNLGKVIERWARE